MTQPDARCPSCGRDTRTYTPLEFELLEAERHGRLLGLIQAAGLVRASGWLVFSKKVADALEYAAEVYRR